MALAPQFRKRKFNKNDVQNPKNSEVKNAETTNKNDVNKANTKKAKKNKIVEKPVESITDNVITEVTLKKTKKNKDKTVKNPIARENSSDVAKAKKMKFVEMSNEISEDVLGKPKAKKSKKNKSVTDEEQNGEEIDITVKKLKENDDVETSNDTDDNHKGITEEMIARYPILKDEEVIKKFEAVSMTNNQKGRTRSQMRRKLRGTSEDMLPEAINTHIQALLKDDNTNWMKVRILFNMLKIALKGKKPFVKKAKSAKKQKKEKTENGTVEKSEQKVKGPKRYVVFIGNLALDITKEKILEHFSDLSEKIISVRIPKPRPSKKSAIAYLEVADELTYELSLSKHHTMLDNKRINVLYSTQKESKISKTEAKGKAAKLVAMQKSGQLAGSEPLSKKRSARRKKMKLAQKKAQEAAERGV